MQMQQMQMQMQQMMRMGGGQFPGMGMSAPTMQNAQIPMMLQGNGVQTMNPLQKRQWIGNQLGPRVLQSLMS